MTGWGDSSDNLAPLRTGTFIVESLAYTSTRAWLLPWPLPSSLLASADIRAGDHVVHIGAGVGYYTAIMACLVGPSDRITGIEFDAGFSAVGLYPCEGGRDDVSEAALDAAFQKGGWRAVTRLYRTGDLPDDRCWLRGAQWALAYD
jgi:hypothetical protein